MAHDLVSHPLFGVTVSVAAYACGLAAARKWPRIHPLFVSSGLVIALLLAARIPYEDYKAGGDLLTFFLGPATVALGVPLYKYRLQLKRYIVAVCTGITVGSLTGMASAGLFAWLFGGSREIILSLMPKSVSSPISIEISRLIGGIPELSAVLTVLTGLLGSMFGRAFLKRLRIDGELPVGIAFGTATHGIGTARLLRDSEYEGGVSAFAMAMAGIATAILFVPVVWWVGR